MRLDTYEVQPSTFQDSDKEDPQVLVHRVSGKLQISAQQTSSIYSVHSNEKLLAHSRRSSFSHLHSRLEEVAMGLVGYQDFTAEAEEEEDEDSYDNASSTYEIGGRSETIL